MHRSFLPFVSPLLRCVCALAEVCLPRLCGSAPARPPWAAAAPRTAGQGGAPHSSAVPGAGARSPKEGKSSFSWAPEQFCGLVSAVLHKK